MAGFWNIFPVYGHINDRLGVTVVDPSTPYVDPETAVKSPFHPNLPLIGGAAAAVSFGAIMAVTGRKKKTRKILKAELNKRRLIAIWTRKIEMRKDPKPKRVPRGSGVFGYKKSELVKIKARTRINKPVTIFMMQLLKKLDGKDFCNSLIK